MTYALRACKLELITDGEKQHWNSPLDILAPDGSVAMQFAMMCAAMFEDIQNPEGSGANTLEGIRQIEAGEIEKIEADGNAWIAHITRNKVWFEGLYNQGEGGEVSLAQYKLAVQTYVRFLADPEQKPIEVPFPAT
jgi:hypothetical protein